MIPQSARTLIEEAEHWIAPHRVVLGRDLPAYLNHVRRVLCFYAIFCEQDGIRPDPAAAVAAAYHDLGIWTDGTFDYLEPSRQRMEQALFVTRKTDLSAAASAMLLWHHKLTPTDPKLPYGAELFRRADWLDVSLGLLRFGMLKKHVRLVRREFPNLGFHWKLVTLTLKQLLRRPWRPLPMLRW